MKKLFAVVVLCAVVVAGCTAAQWFQVIGALIPIATQTALSFASTADALKGGALTAAQTASIDQYSMDAQEVFSDIGQDVTSVQSASTNEAKIQQLLSNLTAQSKTLIPSLYVTSSPAAVACEQFVTTILADATDIANLVPTLNGSPVSSTSQASRITGWPESDFMLVSWPQGTTSKTVAVATNLKVRQIQRSFIERHNKLRTFKTGDAGVDAAMAKVRKQHGPTWVGSLVRGQRP